MGINSELDYWNGGIVEWFTGGLELELLSSFSLFVTYVISTMLCSTYPFTLSHIYDSGY